MITEENTHEQLTLPAKYYTSQEYFREELEQFFVDKWICVGREDQVARPGDYFLVDLAGESVIVTRDDKGQIGAFFNVCRHRGTRLCDKESGTFTGRIACPYHAWTYALDGRLVGAPHMSDATNFSPSRYSLHRVASTSWDGYLFLNLSGKAGALSEQLGAMKEKFRDWKSEDLRMGKRVLYSIKANWKLIVQNYSECLHCPVIHPTLKKLSHYMSGDNEPHTSQYLGGSMALNEGVTTMSVTGASPRPALPGLDAKQKRHVYYYWVMPNLLLSLHPDYVMAHTLWPKQADLTEVVCEWLFHKDEVTKPAFSADDVVGFWDEVNKEDWRVSELSQLGISSRAYTPGPYSKREGLLYGLDSILTGREI